MNSTVIAEINNQIMMLEPIIKRMEKGEVDKISLSFVQLSHMRFQNNLKTLSGELSSREKQVINKYKVTYNKIERLYDTNISKEKIEMV